MPGEAQSLQELVPSLDREVTAMAAGPKESVIVSLAVGLSVLQVEGVVANGLLAGGAQEAVHMPGLLQGIDDFPEDLLLTAAAGGGEELPVAVLAVDSTALLHEAQISHRAVAVCTVELLRVPRLPHGH